MFKRVIAALLGAIMLGSCSAQESGSDAESTSIRQTLSTPAAVTSRIADASAAETVSAESSNTDRSNDLNYPFLTLEEKKQYCGSHYPDKTVLTWVLPNTVSHEKMLNDYLYSNGYPYVICFKSIMEETFSKNMTFADIVSEMKQNNDQVDIIDSCGRINGQDVVSNLYYYFSAKGIYEPLDQYLADEKFTPYYSSLPRSYWDTYKYNGHIYGIDNSYSSLSVDSGFEFHLDVLEKTGLEAPELDGTLPECSEKLTSFLETVKKPLSLVMYFHTFDMLAANRIEDTIVLSDKKAVNVFEQPYALEFYKACRRLSDKGLARIDNEPADDAVGTFITARATEGKNQVNPELKTVRVFSKVNNKICSPYHAIGIFSGSLHKEEAADALLNIIYNKELNNIVTYGVEGKDYNIADGYAVPADKALKVDTALNNPLVSLPCRCIPNVIAPFDCEKLYNSAEYLDGFGFLFDGTDIKEDYLKVAKLITGFTLQSAKSEADVENYLNKFNKELYDNGLQTVLDEVNRQYEEFIEKGSN